MTTKTKRSSTKLPTPVEARILYHCLINPEGAETETLWQATGTTDENASNFYVLVHRMKERGWITSIPSPHSDDKRTRSYKGTRQGLTAYKAAIREAEDLYRNYRIR